MKRFLKNDLILIFLVTAAIRLLYVLSVDINYLSPDSSDWNRLAQLMMHGGPFDSTYRGPVYVFFLSAIYSIFGINVMAVRVVQALLSALNCLLIFKIGEKLFSRRIGVIAAIIASFYPYFIYLSADIMAETLFTFLVSASIAALLIYREKPTLLNAAAAGISAGLTVLCKGTFLPFFCMALAWLLFILQGTISYRFKKVLLISLFTAVTLFPWALRNYTRYHAFVLTGLGGESLWLANNPEVAKLETLQPKDADKLELSFIWFDPAFMTETLKKPPLEADRIFSQTAKKYMMENPKQVVLVACKRFIHFWRLYPMIATQRNKIVAMCTSGIILPLGWLGIILSWKAHWRETSLLLMLLASFTFLHMIFLSNIRYRIPLDPAVIVFAAFTLCVLFEHLPYTFRSRFLH